MDLREFSSRKTTKAIPQGEKMELPKEFSSNQLWYGIAGIIIK
jgi:hypothetical protein